MTIFEFVIFGLATWRVSSLLVNEGGPGNIFVKLRTIAGIEHDQEGIATIIPEGFFSGILSCIWCCSMWVALFWVAFYIVFPELAMYSGIVFGVSTLAIVIERLIGL